MYRLDTICKSKHQAFWVYFAARTQRSMTEAVESQRYGRAMGVVDVDRSLVEINEDEKLSP